jgi:hypothetical protein
MNVLTGPTYLATSLLLLLPDLTHTEPVVESTGSGQIEVAVENNRHTKGGQRLTNSQQ